jgi:hypothetical protein
MMDSISMRMVPEISGGVWSKFELYDQRTSIEHQIETNSLLHSSYRLPVYGFICTVTEQVHVGFMPLIDHSIDMTFPASRTTDIRTRATHVIHVH